MIRKSRCNLTVVVLRRLFGRFLKVLPYFVKFVECLIMQTMNFGLAAALIWGLPSSVLLAVLNSDLRLLVLLLLILVADSDSVGSESAKLVLVANSNCSESESADLLGLLDRCQDPAVVVAYAAAALAKRFAVLLLLLRLLGWLVDYSCFASDLVNFGQSDSDLDLDLGLDLLSLKCHLRLLHLCSFPVVLGTSRIEFPGTDRRLIRMQRMFEIPVRILPVRIFLFRIWIEFWMES